ncbi:MAG: hypothetical protein WDN04_16540 [Rhodospirillales bacterium]
MVPALALLAAACASPDRTAPGKPAAGFDPAQFAKTDIDRVAEAHQQAIFTDLRILAEKLYRRNPREWRKAGHPSVEAAVTRIFEGAHAWQFSELQGKRGADALYLSFNPDYQGDRVLAFIAGLGSMIQTAFHDKTAFFVLDDLDAQALYNAARNVEIAVWKLSNARGAQGTLILLSNEGAGSVPNLSFEREFGKVIGNLDLPIRHHCRQRQPHRGENYPESGDRGVPAAQDLMSPPCRADNSLIMAFAIPLSGR